MPVPLERSLVRTTADEAHLDVIFFVGPLDVERVKQLRDAGCEAALGSVYSAPADADSLDKLIKESETPTPAAGFRPRGRGLSANTRRRQRRR